MRVPLRDGPLAERLAEVRSLGLADIYAARRSYEQVGVWHAFGEDGSEIGAGWSDPGIAPAQWLVDPVGIVHVRGVLEKATPMGTYSKMATLPVELAPPGADGFPVLAVNPGDGTALSSYLWVYPVFPLATPAYLLLEAVGPNPDYRRMFLSHSWARAGG